MPARTATEIQNLPTPNASEPENLLHLFIGDRKCGFREMKRIEVLPDRFVGEPLALARDHGTAW